MNEKLIDILQTTLDTTIAVEDLDKCIPENYSNWDSITHLTIVLALEEAFDVSFEPEEIETMFGGVPAIKSVLSQKI